MQGVQCGVRSDTAQILTRWETRFQRSGGRRKDGSLTAPKVSGLCQYISYIVLSQTSVAHEPGLDIPYNAVSTPPRACPMLPSVSTVRNTASLIRLDTTHTPTQILHGHSTPDRDFRRVILRAVLSIGHTPYTIPWRWSCIVARTHHMHSCRPSQALTQQS